MKLQRIETYKNKLPPNYKGKCPLCGANPEKVVYVHDMRCLFCDNRTVVYCVECREHFQVMP
jgi:hypothetical protein